MDLSLFLHILELKFRELNRLLPKRYQRYQMGPKGFLRRIFRVRGLELSFSL